MANTEPTASEDPVPSEFIPENVASLSDDPSRMKYGFCLVEDAMSEGQCSYMRNRLEEQAEAERECGLADLSPHFHIMWTLVNKGDCFAKCIEFSPEWVQGGPLIEQLNNELLGRGHYAYSFASNIARPAATHKPDWSAGRERGQRRHAGDPD